MVDTLKLSPEEMARMVQHIRQTPPPFKFNLEATAEGLRISILNHLKFTLARTPSNATKRDWWYCSCMAIRDRILERFLTTVRTHSERNTRRLYYLSLEYLMGRLLDNNARNTLLLEPLKLSLKALGLDYEHLRNEENDMGLGNGGLGRLAACFLDSLATLQYPAIGYGIHYEFGLFMQEFVNCQQVEHPDNWLRFGNPWHIVRPDNAMPVHIYGHVENHYDDRGNLCPRWISGRTVIGVPWDIPIVGYGCHTVNYLRLWESRASHEFDLQVFNQGNYSDAVQSKVMGETISKILYPNDKTENGKELRLVQQYFFVACSLQDIIRRYKKQNTDITQLADKAAVQLNDTHPAIAVIELMRLLIDHEGLTWDVAWGICQRMLSYTNHTLMPEALEKWGVPLFGKVLPRHLQIIYEINQRFLREAVELRWPGDDSKKMNLSLIQESEPKMVRMAHIAVVGSHSTNGVAALHTQLLEKTLFADFYALYPERFNNKTNGITPRRWLLSANPALANLITGTIGDEWITNLCALEKLAPMADDASFQEKFMKIKHDNKIALAQRIHHLCHIEVDPNAIFDVQIKRLHEYKRQHLNLLHILTLYRRLLNNPDLDIHPRVFIFAAKAAPGYELAKNIIRAINCVGEKINHDLRIQGKLKIAFMPNYGVTLAEEIIPAADVSEQISTAGTEASGTGNMKLALNGALTIGTLDGANVEILQAVGKDNIFIFGHTVEEIQQLHARGYNPLDIYQHNEELRQVIGWLNSDAFTPHEQGGLSTLSYSLLQGGDPYYVLADYDAYCTRQADIDAAYKNRARWAKMAILNTAHMGPFSSDRTIAQYAEEIWKLDPLPIPHGQGDTHSF